MSGNMTRGQAEILALQALAWLAGQEDLLQVFLGSSGLSQGDLRARADDPEMMAAVLDFLLMDDAWIMGFCGDAGHRPEAALQARAALPGGADPHWT